MERCRMVFSGSGGQGVITAAIILAEAAVLYENLIAVQSQMYGPDRIIFGSDYPFGMPGSQLDQIKNMGIAEKDLEKICGKNILKLLKIDELVKSPIY